MKKCISFLIALIIAGTMSSPIHAQQTFDPSPAALKYARDMDLLNCFELNILQKRADDYEWSKPITLGEASCAILQHIGINRDTALKSSRNVRLPFDGENLKPLLRPYVMDAYRLKILPQSPRANMRITRLDITSMILAAEGVPVPIKIDDRTRTYLFKDVKKDSRTEAIMISGINRGFISAVNATTSGARSLVRRGDAMDMLYKSMLISESEKAFQMTQAMPSVTIYAQPPTDIPHMDTFFAVWEIATNNHLYKDTFDREKAIYDAINGFLKNFDDPYTSLMTPQENRSFSDSINGSLEGIGAYISKENDQLTIVSPIKRSPAEMAGLQSGDIILKINGEDTKDLTLQESVNRIKGPKDTQVILTIQRGNAAPFDVTITRARVNIPSVELDFRDGIAYINLYQFGDKTLAEWRSAVERIQSTGANGIILDLRNNPGGLLHTVEVMLGDFVEKGKPIVQIAYDNVREEILSVGDGKLRNYPIIVLINKGSASASEILAGAIKDHRLGKIIGETSYGKGTVQELTQFFDGSSLRLTIAEWLTPNGHSINKNGIAPDINVVNNPETRVDEAYERALLELKF